MNIIPNLSGKQINNNLKQIIERLKVLIDQKWEGIALITPKGTWILEPLKDSFILYTKDKTYTYLFDFNNFLDIFITEHQNILKTLLSSDIQPILKLTKRIDAELP